MNEITINNINIAVKEYKSRRVVTFKDIDALHSRTDGTARKRFNDNRAHFIEGEDYFRTTCNEVRPFFGHTVPNGFNPKAEIILLTESGYLMLVKSFTDDLAWSVQRQLVNSYFKTGAIENAFSNLSPQLQTLISLEIRQNQQEQAIKDTNRRIDHIAEVVSLDSNSWREDARHLISKIAFMNGGFEHTKDVYTEIFELVDKRAGVSLATRLRNKQQRMSLDGATKSKINGVTKVDIISEDKKLIEIYLAIVKELAVKSGVNCAQPIPVIK